MTAILAVILRPQVLGFLVIAGALTWGVLHYTGIKADLAHALEDVASARKNLDKVIGVANGNAEQLRKAQEQHRVTLGVLAELEADKDSRAAASSKAEADILTASPEDNPPVAGVLETLRRNRFGGRP